MSKRIFVVIVAVLLSIVLFGCQPVPTPTTALLEGEVVIVASVTATETLEPTATNTPKPTKTSSPTRPPTRTEYPTKTVNLTPTQTPTTFNLWVTYTHSFHAICPTKFKDNPPKPSFINFSFDLLQDFDFEQDILDYLNVYGPKAIQQFLDQEIDPGSYSALMEEIDLTNDGIAEIIIETADMFIFSCDDGIYKKVYKGNYYYKAMRFPHEIYFIEDGNQNGFPEIIIHTWFGTSRDYVIIEWSKNGFRYVITPKDLDNWKPEVIAIESEGKIYFEDVDLDESFELIIENGIRSYPWGLEIPEYFPLRNVSSVYEWNGNEYIHSYIFYEYPQFRYQAVQDADNIAIRNDFNKALTYYQDVIFSSSLSWFTESVRDYEYYLEQLVFMENLEFMAPPPEDPAEYHYLASYARFRIMLLYVLQGWLSDAQVVYETQQAMYPEGQAGHEFALMAEQFWLEYQQSGDIGLACGKAIAVAEQHPEILAYLGGPHHSTRFDKLYAPVDVCPFGNGE